MRREIEENSTKEFVYRIETDSIEITVLPSYLEEHSRPDQMQYVWAYQVKITNNSSHPVQLISRHWLITDANGFQNEVNGLGVIGEQPTIPVKGIYKYSSFASLSTQSGIMGGTYQMLSKFDGRQMQVQIPTFSLDSPEQKRYPN